VTRVDLSVPLMCHDLSDLGVSLFLDMTPKKCALKVHSYFDIHFLNKKAFAVSPPSP